MVQSTARFQTVQLCCNHSKMQTPDFDTELFIDEVQKRKCIWDMESEDYKNRVLKRSAWQEIVDVFAKEEDNMEEKTVLGKY